MRGRQVYAFLTPKEDAEMTLRDIHLGRWRTLSYGPPPAPEQPETRTERARIGQNPSGVPLQRHMKAKTLRR